MEIIETANSLLSSELNSILTGHSLTLRHSEFDHHTISCSYYKCTDHLSRFLVSKITPKSKQMFSRTVRFNFLGAGT